MQLLQERLNLLLILHLLGFHFNLDNKTSFHNI
jgi:hypothetical protein